MFIHSRTKGFFLREKEYGEDSRIFTVFTKDFGKIKVFGKAIRKIKSKAEIEFIQGKIHKTLTDVVLLNEFRNLKTDSNRFQVASNISKDLNDLVHEGERDDKIWQLLEETFQKLDNWRSGIIYHYFFWNLTSILGYKPELYYCHTCRQKLTKEKSYLFSKENGIICKSCFQKTEGTNKESYLNININTIKILRIILKKDWKILQHLKIKQEDKNNLNSILN